ncbi:3'-5' exonuclease [Portibacter marinus]|uniref:3'-5' exonuclease n=1 Tax=Portibacter marinus TaxID=2898660 RepID=UPI001F482BC1|nr:3'-5' exonuclease [Portibacter marinus]
MDFIVFDLEATCWLGRPPQGITEIIEIGAVKYNGYGEQLGKFSKFIRPTVNPVLSPFCKKLTSISQENVDRSHTFERVIEEFMDWVDIYEDDYLLCSWGKFDKTLLRNDCILHKVETDWLESHIDIKKQYHRYKGSKNEYGLKKSLRMEGLDFDGVEHRAISDAENTGKLFTRYIDIWQY